MKKESLPQRIRAESFYNELFSLECRKNDLLNELKRINERLQALEKRIKK